MKKLIFLSFSFLFYIHANAQPFGMYISAEPTSCNAYSYEIMVHQYGYPVSNLLMGMELNFGDGVVDEIQFSKDSFYNDDNNGRTVTKYTRTHTFPGPGIYNMSLRFFNRSSDLQNMDLSINTPFYIETTLIIDPYLGCNTTPVLENFSYLHKMGTNFIQDFSFIDEENDSLSYSFVIPLQDEDIPVINYQFPSDNELEQNKPISNLSIDQINGSLFLNSKNLLSAYSAALNITEWRKVDGDYYKTSSTIFDFVIYYIETENNPPNISHIQDTAIIIGQDFNQQIIASDPDGDSLQLKCSGDFFRLNNIGYNELNEFYLGPLEQSISLIPTKENVRPSPYKAVFSSGDKSIFDDLDINKSMYIWVTDKAHDPNPVQDFTALQDGNGNIKLDWIDIEDELGYIIERSDKYFTDFRRLVVLPAESKNYHDPSVVQGNTYQYRIKAVGTSMSAYKVAEVSTIVTAIDNSLYSKNMEIFPNPSNGTFSISNIKNAKALVIQNISGKVVFRKEYDNPTNHQKSIDVSTGLPKGIYILNAELHEGVISKKILIN